MVPKNNKKPIPDIHKNPNIDKKNQLFKKVEIKVHFNLKKFLTWILVGFLILSFLFSLRTPVPQGEKSLPEILTDIKSQNIEKIEIEGDSIYAQYKDKNLYVAKKEVQTSFIEVLKNANIDPSTVNFKIKDQSMMKAWGNILELLLPVVLTGIIFLWIFRQARGTQDSIFAFGRSKAKLFAKGKQSTTFKDVGGVDEVKQELEEIVDFLKHPKKYEALGARTPKGVLLIGPSGTGKTLLARAVAGEAGVPYFSMAGSEFMEMLVGVGASVTGDTPVLIRQNGKVQLMPIASFVDPHCANKDNNKFVIPVSNAETLGFTKKITKFWGSQSNKRLVFDHSSWQPIVGVFRHRAKEIYEVEFLGGKIRTTADHSVFIRKNGGIEAIKVSQLKKGDILVNLPMNTREWNKELGKTIHRFKKHKFDNNNPEIFLDIWNEDKNLREQYEYSLAQQGKMYQYEIAQTIGVCQMTVSNWQRGVHVPQLLSRKLVKLDLPERVKITPNLLKLFGYYTAEGRATGSLEFTFGIHESDHHNDCIKLMKQEFNLKPVLKETDSHSLRILYYSHHLGRFFSRYCGNGSHNKHLPEFIWELPEKYFLAYLEGYTNGDGYITKTGKLVASSVSRQLILELAWLCSMHGIKTGIKHEIIPGGRVIRNRPLPDSEVWTLIIGKTSNPFLKATNKYPYQFKKCYVKNIIKKQYDDYVYDLCGVENEAFFGGEKPILLHNSRVRDLFSNAKKASPAIIFIDEIDAIGRIRGLGVAGGHDEREQTLNQILVEMDGFTPNIHVIVVAASVTGDTQVLIKENDEIKLVPIGEFIDNYFEDSDKDGEVKVDNIECLGFERKVSKGNLTHKNLYFDKSAFKKVSSLFRHKVNEIYEIKYLGGEIKATGNHSVFIRDKFGIKTKAVLELKKGDILVDLPYKVNRTNREFMEIRRHQFNLSWSLTLPFFDQKIEQVWQNGIGGPRAISKDYFKHEFPEKIKITPDFCRLLGYYVAEGYARSEVDFCFSIQEDSIIKDLINLIKKYLGISPDQIRHQTPGAVNIVYAAAPLAGFLIRHCGKGAANKHTPSFLFEASYEYFIEFLKGVWLGDGYEDKRGRGEITSVSKRLIVELNWLCRMHGMKTYVHSFTAKEGRRINNGKPLKAVKAYRLGWGKANNPFNKHFLEKTYPVKRAIIQEVKRVSFKGFVYDLCGVENEAFFGGESPILLHNTNRGDLLDPALMRPGRFDRRVILDLPDIEGRKKIIEIHKRGKPFEKDINWDGVAKRTVGFSGADLENMLNEAAIQAAVKNRKAITWDDIEEAATKVKMGPEKKRLQTKLDKEMTAYHEAGHAVATYHLPHMDTVHRVSIVSRGMALGYTMIPPNRDRIHETQSHLQQMIVSLLGGRAAEEIQFQEFTTGGSSDIQRATEIARKMVTEFGMSELGPINLGPQVDVAEWGRSYYEPTQISPEMSAKIDREIKIIVDKAYKETVKILKAQKPKLDLIAKKLIEKETIEGEEFKTLMEE